MTPTLWLVFSNDAYEIILDGSFTQPKAIVRYPQCLNTRGELVNFDDLSEELQEKIKHKLLAFEKDSQE